MTTINNVVDQLDRFAKLVKVEYEAAKLKYPDLDELIAAAERVDPDVGWLDVVAYLDGGAPTHFSEAIDACGLPVQKRLRRSGQ